MNFDQPPVDPVQQIHEWLEEAREGAGLPNSNAMALATVDADGRPSARMVLLKGLDPTGAVFYTNRNSRKASAIESTGHAALLFHWDTLNRQIRIEGQVSRTSDAESDAYFATRPRGSQIGAWASAQSTPVEDRATLESEVAAIESRFADQDVPRPPHWGGYRVSLDRIEFWQGHVFRVHDRLVYTPDGAGGWGTVRLCP